MLMTPRAVSAQEPSNPLASAQRNSGVQTRAGPPFASMLLRQLKPQEPAGRETHAIVTGNLMMEQLAVAFKKFAHHYCMFEGDRNYALAESIAEKLNCSAKEIEEFSIFLGGCKFPNITQQDLSYAAGMFLSALINRSSEKNFIIHTEHLYFPIDQLGYKNTRNITVRGGVGMNCGTAMESGSITIDGDSGYGLGRDMAGGSITANGNAIMVGIGMIGGKITVHDDCIGQAGYAMRGGTVVSEGKIEKISSDIEGGNIFQRNMQIVKDGMQIAEPV